MKKRIWLCFVLVFFFSVSFTHATITLQGPSKTTVSLGDDIQVSGSITQPNDVFGLFKFDLVCNQRQTVLVKSLSLQANVPKSFDESLAMNQFLDGPCVIEAFLEVNGQTIESVQSSSFSLTRELLGDIQLDKTTVQLGEEIEITGVITRPDGSAIDGSAQILFKKESIVYLQEIVSVKSGKFKYKYDTLDNPAGSYTVEIDVADAFNNQQLFVVEGFTILGALTLSAQTQQSEFLPGDTIKVSGSADAGSVSVKDGFVKVLFNNEEFEDNIGWGKFKLSLPIPEDIKSGSHTLSLTAVDEFGNREVTSLEVSITPVPTILSITTNADSLLPTEQITIQPTLFDQGGDIIATDIDIMIKDSEDDVVFQEFVPSNDQTSVNLPESALPGSWMISASALDVSSEKEIIVNERMDLAFAVDGEILFITNTGNVLVEKSFSVILANENNGFEIIREFKISPGKSVSVDLARGTDPGSYSVSVDEASFENIVISKRKSIFMFPWKYVIGVIVTILVLWVAFKLIKNTPRSERRYRKRVHKQQRVHHRRHRSEKQHVEKFHQDMHDRVEKKRGPLHFVMSKRKKDDFIMELPKKKVRRSYAMPKEVDSFASRDESKYPVYNDPAPREDEYKNVDPFRGGSGDDAKDSVPEKKKGLFNMFD